jgi:hypothetical protein
VKEVGDEQCEFVEAGLQSMEENTPIGKKHTIGKKKKKTFEQTFDCVSMTTILKWANHIFSFSSKGSQRPRRQRRT